MIPYMSDNMLQLIRRLHKRPLPPHKTDQRTLRALERRHLVYRKVVKSFAKKLVVYKLTVRGLYVYRAYTEA